jgi:hypothetical protein
MARVIRLLAAARMLPALTVALGNRSPAHIANILDLLEHRYASALQLVDRICHPRLLSASL